MANLCRSPINAISHVRINETIINTHFASLNWGVNLTYTAKEVLELFPAPRFRDKIQKIALYKVAQAFFENGYKVVALQAPTGSGKSLINTAIARAFKDAYLTTPQVMLINQLERDEYIRPHAAFIKGREHYPCIYETGLQADVARCVRVKKFECPFVDECPYYVARKKAEKAKIAAMTFAYFLIEGGKVFQKRELLVVDECHTVEQWGYMQVDIRVDERRFPIQISIPEINSIEEAKEWIEMINTKVETVRKNFDNRAKIQGLTEDEARYHKRLLRTETKLKRFLKDDGEWVFEIERDGLTKALILKPLKTGRFLKNIVWKRADKYLLSSATILSVRKFLMDVGIDANEALLIDVPSTFPKENRKTVDLSEGKMTKDQINATLPKVVKTIHRVLIKHKNEKGLIHCHSYKLQQEIVNKLRLLGHGRRIVVHNGDDRNEILENWINREDNSVLFSVNMTEGLDLKDDLARWQVIVKCPYPSLEDKRVKARLERGEWDWYNLQTLRTIIQACGRIVRSPQDYGITYFLDSSIMNLIRRYKKYCPKWFLEQITDF